MQFSVFTLLAAASLAAAAPQGAGPTGIVIDPRWSFHPAGHNLKVVRAPEPLPFPMPVAQAEQDSGCTYVQASYMSSCARGENVFCTGNTNVCPSGVTDSFDAYATKQNEGSCENVSPGTGCMQTIACCPS